MFVSESNFVCTSLIARHIRQPIVICFVFDIFGVQMTEESSTLRQRQIASASAGVSATAATAPPGGPRTTGSVTGAVASGKAVKSTPSAGCCTRFCDWLWRPVSIDVRALAALRILYGILLVADTILRARDIRMHYTDFGVMPANAYSTEFQPSPYYFSLHLASGTLVWQIILFVAAGLAGLFMIAGYHTRVATVVGYVLLASVQNRFVYICNKGMCLYQNRISHCDQLLIHSFLGCFIFPGDMLFRTTFFWLMFLPLGATFSLDAVLSDVQKYVYDAPANRAAAAGDEKADDDNNNGKSKSKAPVAVVTDEEPPATASTRLCSAATVGFVLQVLYSYGFSGSLKTGDEWWVEGSASYYALSGLEFVSPLGLRVRDLMTPAMHRVRLPLISAL